MYQKSKTAGNMYAALIVPNLRTFKNWTFHAVCRNLYLLTFFNIKKIYIKKVTITKFVGLVFGNRKQLKQQVQGYQLQLYEFLKIKLFEQYKISENFQSSIFLSNPILCKNLQFVNDFLKSSILKFLKSSMVKFLDSCVQLHILRV